MKCVRLILALAMAKGVLATAYGIPNHNFGFDDGTTSGWTASGEYSVVSEHSSYAILGPERNYAPQNGSFFARLNTITDSLQDSTLSRSFTVNANQSLRGWAAFDTPDYDIYNDNAFVRLVGPDGSLTLWSASVQSVGDFNNTPWQQWSYTFLNPGTYTLTLGVATGSDDPLGKTYALFDAIFLPDGGSTLMLLGGSFLGLMWFGKRRIQALKS